MSSRLLLLSNSRSPDGAYLRWPAAEIKSFLTPKISKLLFIPYAVVPAAAARYADYAALVGGAFAEMGYALASIHEAPDPQAAVQEAQALVIGGGNTFQLLTRLYASNLIGLIAARVRAGMPYIGWSAGANVACPTIRTTNDMPIVEPPTLRALNLVPFQINPHYTDAHPPGHQGETRDQRIAEFLVMNPAATVIGLREGALLHCEEGAVRLAGAGARIFRAGQLPEDRADGEVLGLENR